MTHTTAYVEMAHSGNIAVQHFYICSAQRYRKSYALRPILMEPRGRSSAGCRAVAEFRVRCLG